MEKQWEELYRQRFKEHGFDARSLLYPTQDRLEAPYWPMLRRLEVKGKTLLDVGCGFGRLAGFLKEQDSVPSEYVGIEQIKEYADKARAEYPDWTIMHANFMETPVQRSGFDVVCGFGILATTQNFAPLLERMLEWSKGWLVFDALSQPFYKGKFCAHDPASILDWALSHSPSIWMEHHPSDQFFTMGVGKP